MPQPQGSEELAEAAQALSMAKSDLTVLGDDPFDADTPAKLQQAEWFAEQWRRFSFGQGAHVRRVHYRISVQAGDVLMPDGHLYVNDAGCWDRLGKWATFARDNGLVDADQFADRYNSPPRLNDVRPEIPIPEWTAVLNGRPITEIDSPDWLPTLPQWRNPRSIEFDAGGDLEISEPDDAEVEVEVDGYQLARADRAAHMLVWVEKSTVDDILVPLCRRLGIDFAAGRGYTSRTRIVEALQRAQQDKRKFVVLTISDFDPNGVNMPMAYARVLEFYRESYSPDIDIVVHHLGLTGDQVAEYALPRKPLAISEYASVQGKIDRFEDLYGGEGAVELDALVALHPGVLERLVRDAVDAFTDDDLEDRLAEAEAAAQESAEQAHRAEAAEGSRERDRVSDEASRIVERFREEITEIRQDRDKIVGRYNRLVGWLWRRLLEKLGPVEQRYADARERFGAEMQPHTERVAEIWADWQRITDTLEVDLPNRPAPEVDGIKDPLFDSERHWFEQLQRYRLAQGLRPDPRRQPIPCIAPKSLRDPDGERCGRLFTPSREGHTMCSPACRQRARKARLREG